MQRLFPGIVLSASALATLSFGAAADDGQPSARLSLTRIATYDAGGLGSAEIVAFHPDSQRLFVVNAATLRSTFSIFAILRHQPC